MFELIFRQTEQKLWTNPSWCQISKTRTGVQSRETETLNQATWREPTKPPGGKVTRARAIICVILLSAVIETTTPTTMSVLRILVLFFLVSMARAKYGLDLRPTVYDTDSEQLCLLAFFDGPYTLDRPQIDASGLCISLEEGGLTANFSSEGCRQEQAVSVIGISAFVCSRVGQVHSFKQARLDGHVSLLVNGSVVQSFSLSDVRLSNVRQSATNYHALGGIPYCQFYESRCAGQCLLYCRDVGRKPDTPYIWCKGNMVRVTYGEITYQNDDPDFPLSLNSKQIVHIPDRNLTCMNLDNILPVQATTRMFYNRVTMSHFNLDLKYFCGLEERTAEWNSRLCQMKRRNLLYGQTQFCYLTPCLTVVSGPLRLAGSVDLALRRERNNHVVVDVKLNLVNMTFDFSQAELVRMENPMSVETRCAACLGPCEERCRDIALNKESIACTNQTPKFVPKLPPKRPLTTSPPVVEGSLKQRKRVSTVTGIIIVCVVSGLMIFVVLPISVYIIRKKCKTQEGLTDEEVGSDEEEEEEEEQSAKHVTFV